MVLPALPEFHSSRKEEQKVVCCDVFFQSLLQSRYMPFHTDIILFYLFLFCFFRNRFVVVVVVVVLPILVLCM